MIVFFGNRIFCCKPEILLQIQCVVEAASCKTLDGFADNLEKACIDTIESGKMTKDLALITELENPVVLNSLDFIKAIRETLEKMYA